MKTLTLSLKKKWFDMIKAGIKKEEYREIKPYYESRFYKTFISGFGTCEPEAGHRSNSAQFLAEMIFSSFKNSVVPYDKNLVNYPKETKELLKLCKKACERIAKEVA